MRVRSVVAVMSLAMLVVPVSGSAQSPVPVVQGSEDPGTVVFTGSGAGGVRTAEFALAPGDHRLTYTVQAPEGEAECGMGFTLLTPADSSYFAGIGNNGAYVAAGSPYHGETWFHVPAAGSFALDVGGDCDWEATLAAVPSPLESAPYVITGSAAVTSPSFVLGAGDHVIHYRATNPSTTEACIFFGPGIIVQANGSLVADPVDTVVDPGATLEGELIAYGVPEGRYSFSINLAWCQAGLAEPIDWEVVIDPA